VHTESNDKGQIHASVEPMPATKQINVLIVDDESLMLNLLARTLTNMGLDATPVDNGIDALQILSEQDYDLVLLDVVMPGFNGFEVCREIRKSSNIPIIMLTALNRPDDIVQGFELGADSYITKPFAFKEMEARITALLRRTCMAKQQQQVATVAKVGDILLDNELHHVTVAGDKVNLTTVEFELLSYLMRFENQPVSKHDLLQNVWQYSGDENENLVESAVRRLRRKIEDTPSKPERLLTVRGIGYKLAGSNNYASDDESASEPAAFWGIPEQQALNFSTMI